MKKVFVWAPMPKLTTKDTKMSRRHSITSAKVFTHDFIRTIKSSIFSVLFLSQLFMGHEHHTVAAISSRLSMPSGTAVSTSSTKAEKFGAFMERQPESTVAPLFDEVLFECGLNLVPDKIEWRFRPQKQRNDSMIYMSDFIYLEKLVKKKYENSLIRC